MEEHGHTTRQTHQPVLGLFASASLYLFGFVIMNSVTGGLCIYIYSKKIIHPKKQNYIGSTFMSFHLHSI